MKSNENYNSETASLYASLGISGTTYHVPWDALATQVGTLKGKDVLDFGCGAGRSTRLLQLLSPDRLIGIDHNASMIEQAHKQSYQDIEFRQVPENGVPLPFVSDSFDTVFCFYVYCEFSIIGKMRETTAEIFCILKPNGSFYVITTNPGCLGADFISFHYDQKSDVRDGDAITCYMHTNPPFTIADTWWSLDLFDDVFKNSGFAITKKLFPLGSGNGWRDETRVAPEVIYHLIK